MNFTEALLVYPGVGELQSRFPKISSYFPVLQSGKKVRLRDLNCSLFAVCEVSGSFLVN